MNYAIRTLRAALSDALKKQAENREAISRTKEALCAQEAQRLVIGKQCAELEIALIALTEE